MKYPIFIPTKGRADCAALPRLLCQSGISYTLVVEPQDEVDYRRSFPGVDLLILGGNDRGIVFSRQSILDHARRGGYKWYWQIDDNIRGFHEVKAGRCVHALPETALLETERAVCFHQKIALVALQYQQFAWSSRKQYDWNRRAYCCVLTRTDTGINYRDGMDGKEDVDFMLQHFRAGWMSVTMNHWAMGKPTMGENRKGGLVELYRAGRDGDAARKLVALWPRWCSLVQKGDRLDAEINWKLIDRQMTALGYLPKGGVKG
jgi:hypothetical protein